MSLVIGEELREELGLEVKRYRRVSYANSAGELCKVTEPVEIHWKDRETALPALVVPGVRRVLMGVIPLEDLDLVVDPNKQELVGAHGDEAVYMV
jgi:predicted aspartyl protease